VGFASGGTTKRVWPVSVPSRETERWKQQRWPFSLDLIVFAQPMHNGFMDVLPDTGPVAIPSAARTLNPLS
jgi:hypothetical protein